MEKLNNAELFRLHEKAKADREFRDLQAQEKKQKEKDDAVNELSTVILQFIQGASFDNIEFDIHKLNVRVVKPQLGDPPIATYETHAEGELDLTLSDDKYIRNSFELVQSALMHAMNKICNNDPKDWTTHIMDWRENDTHCNVPCGTCQRTLKKYGFDFYKLVNT